MLSRSIARIIRAGRPLATYLPQHAMILGLSDRASPFFSVPRRSPRLTSAPRWPGTPRLTSDARIRDVRPPARRPAPLCGPAYRARSNAPNRKQRELWVGRPPPPFPLPPSGAGQKETPEALIASGVSQLPAPVRPDAYFPGQG